MKRVRFEINPYCSYHPYLNLRLEIIKEIDLAAGESEKECAVDCAIADGEEPCLGFVYHKKSNRCTLLKRFTSKGYVRETDDLLCYIALI